MSNWEEWFESMTNAEFDVVVDEGVTNVLIEEMYQMFKARLLDEVIGCGEDEHGDAVNVDLYERETTTPDK